MKKLLHRCALALALSFALLPMTSYANRSWMLPSSTVASGKEPIITVDAASSDDLFGLSGMPIKLDGLSITAPDGTAITAENPVIGKHRSSFDLKLVQKGTYRIANVSQNVLAAYKLGGEMKRWRGTADELAKSVPANAEELQVTHLLARVETFVTNEEAGGKALQLTGVGLELIPLTVPTDLTVGDSSNFVLFRDGKPAANVVVTILRGGNRYRYKLGDITLKTDADGKFSVKWPEAGQYWLSANATQGNRSVDNGSSSAATQPANSQPLRRISYSATFEVLPQ